MTRIALVGNPNAGKTTLFNALTGLRHKVGNYPGVTVDIKSGGLRGTDNAEIQIVDLPGVYSLTPHSPDEDVAVKFLFGVNEVPPDFIVNVVDASNLERNLFLTTQLVELGIPMLVVLTMTDAAARRGLRVDEKRLSTELGVPVVSTDAPKGAGLTTLVSRLQDQGFGINISPVYAGYSPEITSTISEICAFSPDISPVLISTQLVKESPSKWLTGIDAELIESGRSKLCSLDIDPSTAIADDRYIGIGRISARSVIRTTAARTSLSERIDQVALHKVGGYFVFLAIITLVFQAIFTWAQVPAEWIKIGIDSLSDFTRASMPSGELRDLLIAGVIGGVGNTLVFLPQILTLLFLLGLLEDSGYLARGAFLLDRFMYRVGLHGKSFIPMLSSFACAVPGIMATRTIESGRERLVTMFVIPLIPCTARIPVYTMLIAAFIPATWRISLGIGSIDGRALCMVALFVTGIAMSFIVAAILSRTAMKSAPSTFMLELPAYKIPRLGRIIRESLDQAWLFIQRAGTMILAISIALWFLSSHPKIQGKSPKEYERSTYAGRVGTLVEPVLKPLGMDWKIGIGLLASVAAREVFVAAMGAIYNVDASDDDDHLGVAVGARMRAQTDPLTGLPAYDIGTGAALLAFFAFAQQCMSTFAVMRRETNGWKWPLLQSASYLILAWIMAFIVRAIVLVVNS
jgi:ferrous iron transport protein B